MEKLPTALIPGRPTTVAAAAATTTFLGGVDRGNASVAGRPVRIVLTVGEAGELLGIGRTLMYSLVSSGAVESITIGRLRRVPVDAVSAYVEALRLTGSSHGTAA
jgi:excisionase family DNA binding protein